MLVFFANSKLKVQKVAFDAIYCLMKNCVWFFEDILTILYPVFWPKCAKTLSRGKTPISQSRSAIMNKYLNSLDFI